MKSRTIEIIDNHIKALEEELEWYQEKNREWQEKCEGLQNKLDTFEANCGLAKHLNFAKSDQIQELRNENARLREQLRWHSVSEFPAIDDTTKRKTISVDVVLKRPEHSIVIAWYLRDRNEWWAYDKGQILVPPGSKWCYIPDDKGTDCTPEGE